MTDQNALARPDALDVDRSALFLDLDGTLFPIAPTPQDVEPDARRTELLRRLSIRLEGRLAVISGRTIADVDRILDGAAAAVAGVHGLERRWPDGRTERPPPDPTLADAQDELTALVARYPGLLIEDKGLALGVHYRGRPEAAHDVEDTARRIAARTGLVIQAGDMVVELRGLGARKGDALNAYMHTTPFLGAVPYFIGDDLTDEDGFSAARALGGEGILVGPHRATAASRRLDDVAAVVDWLSAALG
ncbi:MAG: trehalose-phosphatase [Caulobacteraceae bacterium]|nr:trehalose-phosphatase [Caulobacteraceae bacterium]